MDFGATLLGAVIGGGVTYWFTVHQIFLERRLVALEELLQTMQDLWSAKRAIRRFFDFELQSLNEDQSIARLRTLFLDYESQFQLIDKKFEVLNLYLTAKRFQNAKSKAHEYKQEYLEIIRASSMNVQRGVPHRPEDVENMRNYDPDNVQYHAIRESIGMLREHPCCAWMRARIRWQ